MNKQNPGIGWCDYTWNPITGCLNHVDGLCKGGGFKCYAYKLAHGRLRERYVANTNTAPRFYGIPFVEDVLTMDDPFYPRFWPERLWEPTRLRKPAKIFVCDMGEMFGDWIPREWQRQVFNFIAACPQHTFQFLTKQPQNLARWSPFPDNCWVGVTVTKQDFLSDALRGLLAVDAKVKYLSLEPLLGNINVSFFEREIGWLIIGACTGSWKDMYHLQQRNPELTVMEHGNRWTAQPKIEWVAEIVEAADKAGIPIFLKENLKPLLDELVNEGNRPFPLRQEFPKAKP